ncbi:MAG: hypothetical protein M1820_000933 [Bogoriella megaspora]|nr:MAG: hypothetical protein M1820_000933 [Bogoriella megaspora]
MATFTMCSDSQASYFPDSMYNHNITVEEHPSLRSNTDQNPTHTSEELRCPSLSDSSATSPDSSPSSSRSSTPPSSLGDADELCNHNVYTLSSWDYDSPSSLANSEACDQQTLPTSPKEDDANEAPLFSEEPTDDTLEDLAGTTEPCANNVPYSSIDLATINPDDYFGSEEDELEMIIKEEKQRVHDVGTQSSKQVEISEEENNLRLKTWVRYICKETRHQCRTYVENDIPGGLLRSATITAAYNQYRDADDGDLRISSHLPKGAKGYFHGDALKRGHIITWPRKVEKVKSKLAEYETAENDVDLEEECAIYVSDDDLESNGHVEDSGVLEDDPEIALLQEQSPEQPAAETTACGAETCTLQVHAPTPVQPSTNPIDWLDNEEESATNEELEAGSSKSEAAIEDAASTVMYEHWLQEAALAQLQDIGAGIKEISELVIEKALPEHKMPEKVQELQGKEEYDSWVKEGVVDRLTDIAGGVCEIGSRIGSWALGWC